MSGSFSINALKIYTCKQLKMLISKLTINTRHHSLQRCFSAEELVLILGKAADNSSVLGRSDLARLSPALVQQILSGACTDNTKPVKPDGLTVTESKS